MAFIFFRLGAYSSNITISEFAIHFAAIAGRCLPSFTGRSMNSGGLPGFDDHAAARAIVVHGAWYVSEEIVAHFGMLGRSEGCFALEAASLKEVADRLGTGRLIFADKV